MGKVKPAILVNHMMEVVILPWVHHNCLRLLIYALSRAIHEQNIYALQENNEYTQNQSFFVLKWK